MVRAAVVDEVRLEVEVDPDDLADERMSSSS